MKNCKTCDWWEPRECGNHEKIGELDDTHEAPDSLTYSYDEGGRFKTGPDFGCVHHKVPE